MLSTCVGFRAMKMEDLGGHGQVTDMHPSPLVFVCLFGDRVSYCCKTLTVILVVLTLWSEVGLWYPCVIHA